MGRRGPLPKEDIGLGARTLSSGELKTESRLGVCVEDTLPVGDSSLSSCILLVRLPPEVGKELGDGAVSPLGGIEYSKLLLKFILRCILYLHMAVANAEQNPSTIGMMSKELCVPRKELVDWLQRDFDCCIEKVESCGTGRVQSRNPHTYAQGQCICRLWTRHILAG